MDTGEISVWHFVTRQPIRVRWAGGVITYLDAVTPQTSPDLWLAPVLFDLQING